MVAVDSIDNEECRQFSPFTVCGLNKRHKPKEGVLGMALEVYENPNPESWAETYLLGVKCDHCGELIKKATTGNWEWEAKDDGTPTGNSVFVHKQCSRAFEESHGGRSKWRWITLTSFFRSLRKELE